jgi:hypothetical protein
LKAERENQESSFDNPDTDSDEGLARAEVQKKKKEEKTRRKTKATIDTDLLAAIMDDENIDKLLKDF